ncbi:MAG: insulinase family protein [Oscillospiraceae bacterium]|nr:insulinase family protein [Oscillospiraceae bacterium]
MREQRIIRNEKLAEHYTKAVLDSGLTVLIYEMPQKSSVSVQLSAAIGSVTKHFELDGQTVELPAGVAHFLEHKLFESEQGDAFTLFAQTGASANAFTSFDRTTYLFNTSINEFDALRILIRFVNAPHFTEQSVAKEQGIIGEEIRMYEDDPGWQLIFSLFRLLYKNLPINEDIAGSRQSISQITPQMLYDCCKAFYAPHNMVLAVAGNISAEDVLAVCEEEYAALKQENHSSRELPVAEPQEIVAPFSSRSMEVAQRMFAMGYKEQPLCEEDRIRHETMLDMLLDLVAGESTEFYRELYEEGLINDSFSGGYYTGRGYLCTYFEGESSEPQKVAQLLKARIAQLKQHGLDPQLFEERRRSAYGDAVCLFDSVDAVANNLTYCHFKNCEIYDIMNVIDSITCEEMQQMLNSLFPDERCALSVIEPNS